MTRRLPKVYDLDTIRAALTDPEALFSAFIWEDEPEGHEFWSEQANGELSEAGRSALNEMIALAEAGQAVAA